MLTPGAYARRGLRHMLAIDLGTSSVRIWSPTLGRVIEEPTVVAWGPPGSRRAVGRAALDRAADGDAPLVWPLRDGVMDNYPACVHLLRVLVTVNDLVCRSGTPVLVGVPATATLRQQNLVRAAVRRATGGRVTVVEEPLAAALACRIDLARAEDVVVVDIGHGRTEVVRVACGAVTDAERVDVANAVDQVPAIAAVVRRFTPRSQPAGPRRLLITGGGAISGVAARLAALTNRSVTMPANVRLATIQGLTLLLTAGHEQPTDGPPGPLGQ
ncbi:rod shape-determining protein [Micromonospora sp. DR5-3]|uniref:rod shape-determining protein n=1 Tax=unclassified Micromonospora TaxID=2617518 RepID=UPI0011D785E3|nr:MULTISPECIES: rod shape-determining protein [unclassified Micromonospora]MCW3818128.1 rod shape-determining protein [Micromonospora sp. DR5-3]TYC21783.1 hypothetical protein FXF52_24255 [Micromonospora sp. MP36]